LIRIQVILFPPAQKKAKTPFIKRMIMKSVSMVIGSFGSIVAAKKSRIKRHEIGD